MKKKAWKTVYGVVLAGVLVLGNAKTARAEEGGATTGYSFNKVYQLDGDSAEGAKSPAETFRFESAETTPQENQATLYAVSCTNYNSAAKLDQITKLGELPAGQADSIPDAAKAVTIGSVTYAEGNLSKTTDAASAPVTQPVAVAVTADSYQSMGYYYYEFREKAGNTAGVTYAADTYAVRVAVVNDDASAGALKIDSVRLYKVNADGSLGDKAENVTNEYAAGSLSISKTVTGNMGDRNREFDVTVSFTAPAGTEIHAPIAISTSAGITGNPTEAVIDAAKTGATASVKVKDGTTVVFSNIPKGVTYQVTETQADGYHTPKYNGTESAGGKGGTITDTAAGTGTVGMAQSVEIENKRETTIDTGIFLSNLPYVLVLAGIAAAALLFFAGKKRRDREK
ncbi:DUF7601 domain-containing protein [Laedolimicola sp.]|uniref:DUF7601 domain-containing protein n=1 Tax=Laedolimicola sp. TaxID=2981663 RepID=UPI003F7FB3D2